MKKNQQKQFIRTGIILALWIFLLLPIQGLAYNWPWDQGHDCVEGEGGISGWGRWGYDGKMHGEFSSKDCCELLCKICPVYANTGRLQKTFTDLAVPGVGPALTIIRTYDSQDWATSLLGHGWIFNFGKELIIIRNKAGEKIIGVRSGTGEKNFFRENSDGTLERITAYGVTYDLIKNIDGTYTIKNRGGSRHELRSDGKISKIIDKNNNQLVFEYNSVGCLSKITNASGNYVTFQLGPNGKIASISDNLGRTITYNYDQNGNLTSVSDPMGNTTQYVYNSDNLLTQIIDPRGNVVESATYDNNQPPRVSTFAEKGETYTISYYSGYTIKKDSKGNTWTYYFNDVGVITQVIDPLGNVTEQLPNKVTSTSVDWEKDANGNITTYAYDAIGNIISKTDPLGNTTTYTYIAGTNLIATETNPLGVVTKYEYDANGNQTIIIRDFGGTLQNATAYTYDSKGNQTSVTDPLGRTTHYEYDVNGNLIRVIDPLGNVTAYTYDSRGNKLTETDANGNTTIFAYDLMNRLVSVTDALGNTTTYEYDANGNRNSETDANGNMRTYTYDSYNRLVQQTDSLGNTISYTYDSRDNRISMIDANANTTSYTYNIMNRLIRETNALGGQTNYTYDAEGNILSTTDANGKTTTFTYDANNRKISETNPAGETTNYTYDANGNIATQTLPNGNVRTRIYDSQNRLLSVSDTIGLLVSNTYNSSGLIITKRDALGNTISYSYDANNRIIQESDPLGNSIGYSYDSIGNLLTITDREGRVTTYAYDALRRRISSTDQLGNTTTFSFDKVGNLLSITDANGNVTIYNYDKDNRLIKETYADGTTRLFSYDANGNIIGRTDQNGNMISYIYDALNRRTKIDYLDANDSTFTYDAVGNLINANNQNATISLVYDNAYRLTQSDQNGLAVNYSYDIPNNTKTITYPGGKVVKEVRDQRESLVRVENVGGQAVVLYTYDTANRLKTKTYINGITANLANNANGWITDLSYSKAGSQIIGFQYFFDKEGNRLYESKTHNPSDSEQYLYDAKYRLVHLKRGTLDDNGNIPTPTTQKAYNLDALGNWLSVITNGITENRIHNQMNEVVAVDETSLIYDYNGNLINDGYKTYSYDFENKLIKVARNSDNMTLGEYKYDAFGRRMEKRVSGLITAYYYDEDRIIEERRNGLVEASYVYGRGIDEILIMNRSGQVYHYISDSIGSIIALTDSNGNIVEEYSYDVYGNPSVASSLANNPFKFTGSYYDEESALQYNRFRYYSYRLSRWLTHDPLGYKYGLNLYEYVHSNPVNLIDPYGLRGLGICLKSDWAGRAMLKYLFYGNGLDWNIEDDASWTSYMQANTLLTNEMKYTLIVEILKKYDLCSKDKGYLQNIDITKHVEIDNGECFIGYEYLHGTNASVGDFKLKGSAKRGPGGPDKRCCKVDFDLHYQWNDKIDPNFQYDTDKWKWAIAKILGFIIMGDPKPYDIHIGWKSSSTYSNQEGLGVTSGWPLK